MTNKEFASRARQIATNFKTLYIMGCFGAPMTAKNKIRYTTNYAYNKQPTIKAKIMNASIDTFGFDCVGLIKGLIWGWDGSTNKVYGGATYPTKQMIKDGYCPDFGTESMMSYCTDVSVDFSNIQVGEVLYMYGHAGIYIGDGLAVESTPKWQNKVQITAVGNIGKVSGYNTRTWTSHGKIKYVDYDKEPTPTPTDYFEPNHDYKLLKAKYLRTSPSLGNNVVKYNNLTALSKKDCNNVNGKAQLKKDLVIHVTKVLKEGNGRIWANYGNCVWVCQNIDGEKQAIKVD